jgi:tetratricopeptide (TPR) repeat protein
MAPLTHPSQAQIDALIELLQKGQLDQLVKHATPLVRAFPNTLALHDLMGIAHMGLKNYDKSIACYQNALKIKPNFAEAHNNLGAGLKALGRYNEAIPSYQKAIQLKPNYAEAYNNLGIALIETHQLQLAKKSFNRALQIAPNYADAYFNLASALKSQGHLDHAISNFEKGLQINPNNAVARNHLGNTQQQNGLLDDAVENYNKALLINPKFAEAYLNLGTVQKAQGHMEEALENYRTALRLKPDDAKAYRNYTATLKFKDEDEFTARIPGLLESKALTKNDQMHLSFALAKVRLDLGQNSEAFKHLKTGNALRKQELQYDIYVDQNLFADIKNTFETKTSVTPTKPTQTKPIPIFIVGMPRSGTTLVEQIISSHSDVYGAGELKLMDQIMDNTMWQDYATTPDIIEDIRERYYDGLTGLNCNQPFITDKMPANFRWIGFIAHAFPEAKIIHVTRTPAAVCWSNYKLYFPANGMRFSFDMQDIALYYGLYRDLMKFWHTQFPDRIYDINYERLTENQLQETQNLLSYLDLDWQDAVMDFHKNIRSVATASNQQVRNKMYKGSSLEWERYAKHLGPMLEILNSQPQG